MTDWKTAILNDKGERLAVFDDPHAAFDWAIAQGFDEVFAEELLRRRIPNPQNPLGADGPATAWEQLGNLRVKWAEVERLSLKDAYKRILRLRMPVLTSRGLSSRHERVWPVSKRQKGVSVPIKRWATPQGMAKHLLQDNDKLAKEHPAHPSRVAGLSLLPAYAPAQELIGRVPRVRPGTSFCVGSNAECRDSCLVYSGHNEIDRYNRRIKLGKTGALLADPVAFCRMLYEACRRWNGTWPGGRGQLQPFARLNVFSDLPWELIFPELFVVVPTLMFYDYTKIPARPEMAEEVQRAAGHDVWKFPSNYDLTFSASGTNDQDAHDEWHRGRRVAVVFDTEKHVIPQWYEPAFLPAGASIVDGDEADLRPLDPDAYALEKARQEMGFWTIEMTEKQRKAHIRKVTKLAYRYTFGKDGAPPNFSSYPRRRPVIVGLTYKAPVLTEHRERAEKAQAKGREREARSKTKRAVMVSVVERGRMVVAPDCPKTVTFSSPVIPAAQPGVLALERDESEILAAKRKPAKKRSKKRSGNR